jgi:hypothetical protein
LDPAAIPLPTWDFAGGPVPEAGGGGVLSNVDGCITLRANGVELVALWPIGWTARISQGLLEIRDLAGNVYREGELYGFAGGSYGAESQGELLSKVRNLSQFCHRPPYWLVTGPMELSSFTPPPLPSLSP